MVFISNLSCEVYLSHAMHEFAGGLSCCVDDPCGEKLLMVYNDCSYKYYSAI